MPIYTASFFQPQYQYGRLVAVCRTLPKGVVVDRHLKFLAPPANLLWDYKQWQSSGEVRIEQIQEYKQRYWLHLRSVWGQLSEYLNTLSPHETETWLCWESAGHFCHRNLLLKVIERDWAQHLGDGGGADVPFKIAAPGIAWACKHFKLKLIEPKQPAQTAESHIDRSTEDNTGQLLFLPQSGISSI